MSLMIRLVLPILLSVQICSASARELTSFNGQSFDDARLDVKAKPYGQYNPSQFSSDHQVVLVSWNSEEGKKRLLRSQFNNDFFQLANNYQPQSNPLYCGIASSVILLNTIRTTSGKIPAQAEASIVRPAVLGGDLVPYYLYSQSNLLNDVTDRVKSREVIQLRNISGSKNEDADKFDPGLSLADLKSVLESYKLRVQKFSAEPEIGEGAAQFRKVLKSVLVENENFLLINYKSDMVGQMSSGHISPVGAYDEQSDSVLVLDVAGYQNPWLWIPVTDLYASMHTKDGQNYRGYLVVEEGLSMQ